MHEKDYLLSNEQFNIVPSPDDNRDYKVDSDIILKSEGMSDYIVNSSLDKHICYDQGKTSMCAGFGSTGIQSQIDLLQGKTYQRYSPASVYGNRFDHLEYQGEGQYLRHILKDWHNDGMAKFEDFPLLGSTEECKEGFLSLDPQVRDDMMNHRIASFYRLDHTNTQELYDIMTTFDLPILIGYQLYGSITEGYHNGGILPTPDLINDKKYGGHCSYLAGFKGLGGDVPHKIIPNSWGTEIFDNGIMYMPEEYPIFEAWLVIPYEKKEIRLKIGQKHYTVNGERVDIDTAPIAPYYAKVSNGVIYGNSVFEVKNKLIELGLYTEQEIKSLGRTLVPLRFLMNELGALKVDWFQSIQTAKVWINGDVLWFKLDNDGFDSSLQMRKISYEEGERTGITINFGDENKRMLVPIRKVFEFCGWIVDWDGSTGEVILRNY